MIAIGHAWFIDTCISAFVNAQMVYLLNDEDYFQVDEDYIGRTTSNILLFAFAAGLLYAIPGGWVFDRFMRKWPMFFAVTICALLIGVIPLTSPSVQWLTFVRCML